jgi:hypothetical protein
VARRKQFIASVRSLINVFEALNRRGLVDTFYRALAPPALDHIVIAKSLQELLNLLIRRWPVRTARLGESEHGDSGHLCFHCERATSG